MRKFIGSSCVLMCVVISASAPSVAFAGPKISTSRAAANAYFETLEPSDAPLQPSGNNVMIFRMPTPATSSSTVISPEAAKAYFAYLKYRTVLFVEEVAIRAMGAVDPFRSL